jgi:SAM-dependent methyltransferase
VSAGRAVALAVVIAALLAATLRPAPQPGWLGVSLAEAPPSAVPAARIETVLAESPALRAGLRNGDLVRGAGARTIRTPRDLTATVRRTRPGTPLVLTVERHGGVRTIAVEIGRRPPDLYRLLEAGRDEWQQPEAVLALLGIADGGVVADLGAGTGYFTERLARRVGATGRVIAIEIDREALQQLGARFPRGGDAPVLVHPGLPTDPLLDPSSIDAALLVDTFHELQAPVATRRALRRALRPGGRVVVVDRPAADFVPDAHAIPEGRVVADAEEAGFHVRERRDLPRQFAVAFE